MKTFHTVRTKNSPISVASSAEMEEQSLTSRAGALSTRQETLSTWSTRFGALPLTVLKPSRNYTTPVSSKSPVHFGMPGIDRENLTNLSTFHTNSLRNILHSFWPNTISNKDLLEWRGTISMSTILIRWRSGWIGHVIRQEPSIIILPYTERQRESSKRGNSKITWRRSVKKEMKQMEKTWNGVQVMAKDRHM